MTKYPKDDPLKERDDDLMKLVSKLEVYKDAKDLFCPQKETFVLTPDLRSVYLDLLKEAVQLCNDYAELDEDSSVKQHASKTCKSLEIVSYNAMHTGGIPSDVPFERPPELQGHLHMNEWRIHSLSYVVYFLLLFGISIGIIWYIWNHDSSATSTKSPTNNQGTNKTPLRAVCLVVEEGTLAMQDIPMQYPVEISRDQARELLRQARYFSLLEIDVAIEEETQKGNFKGLSGDVWQPNSPEDIYIRLHIDWQPRVFNEKDKYPIKNSIEISKVITLERLERLPDRATGRSWMHRV